MTTRPAKRSVESYSELRPVVGDGGDIAAGSVEELPVDSHGTVSEMIREIKRLRVELKELREYREIAFQDPLTGLRNRRYFEQRLDEELNRAQRQSSNRFSVIAIDMDNLKYINDHYGHAEGDRILKWVGKFLKGKLRQQDVCCRLGGDEFVALLPEADSDGCHRLMDRIGAALEKTDGDFPIPVRLSMGGITYPDDGTRACELLEAADRLMYRNKRANKLYPESAEFTQSQNRFLREVRQVILSGE